MNSRVGKCVFCEGDTRQWCTSGSEFIKCNKCDLVYRDKLPNEVELDEIYKNYYSKTNLNNRNTNMLSCDASINQHAKYIKKITQPGFRVLDFGAGTGGLINKLSEFGVTADGVEYSIDAANEAKKRYGLELFSNLEEIIHMPDRKYDLIVAVEVIEHLTKPDEVLKLLYSLLKPGGKIYLTTPNRSGLKARLKKCSWNEAVKPFHLILFNYSSLKKMLGVCGFSDVKYLRFSPITTDSLIKIILHRFLQFLGLYGGLRVLAKKP